MPVLRPLAWLAILWIAGCAEVPGDDAQSGGPSPTGGETVGLPGNTPPSEPPAKGGFRVLETGWLTYAETPGFEGRVMRDQAAWEAFWAEHRSGSSEPGTPPAVDFASEVAVAVLMGERSSGGYSIEATNVAAEGSGLVVLYATTSPGGGCGAGAVITYPFQVIAAKAPADTPVEFELEEERVRDC